MPEVTGLANLKEDIITEWKDTPLVILAGTEVTIYGKIGKAFKVEAIVKHNFDFLSIKFQVMSNELSDIRILK